MLKFQNFRLRNLAKQIKLKPSLLIKFKFIEQEASKGNILAKQYLDKLRKEEVSIDDKKNQPTYKLDSSGDLIPLLIQF